MKKLILAATMLAMTIGLATTTTTAFARDRYPELMAMADADKDGMVTKEEFLAAMGKMYDEKMDKFKKMSAASQDKMMKNDAMTHAGFRSLLRELGGR
jgi:DNA gyrase/topoisomerase IV subunit B